MKSALTVLLWAASVFAQSVAGPVLTHLVDAQSRLRPVLGLPSSAHIGQPSRENVRQAWGSLTLLTDGTALRDGAAFEGSWASLVDGAFLSEDGRRVLVVRSTEPWLLHLPSRAGKIRISSNGRRVLAILEDEFLTAWNSTGAAEYRIPASIWWSFDFAGSGAVAYDPAANALISIASDGTTSTLRTLPGEGTALRLAVTADASRAVLLDPAAGLGLILSLTGGEDRSFSAPESSTEVQTLPGGRAFLLSLDPAKPLWLLDPYAENPLLVVPAAIEDGGSL